MKKQNKFGATTGTATAGAPAPEPVEQPRPRKARTVDPRFAELRAKIEAERLEDKKRAARAKFMANMLEKELAQLIDEATALLKGEQNHASALSQTS